MFLSGKAARLRADNAKLAAENARLREELARYSSAEEEARRAQVEYERQFVNLMIWNGEPQACGAEAGA